MASPVCDANHDKLAFCCNPRVRLAAVTLHRCLASQLHVTVRR